MPLPEAYWRLSKLFSTKVTFEERGLLPFQHSYYKNYKKSVSFAFVTKPTKINYIKNE